LDAGCVKQRDEIVSRDRLDRHRRHAGQADQVLMVIGKRRRLAVRR
jgi:hypothetical protein